MSPNQPTNSLLTESPLQRMQEDEEESILSSLDFIKLLIVAKKNLLWVMIFIIISLGVAYLILRYTRPVYESSSVLKLALKNKEKSILDKTTITDESFIGNISGEIEIIRSNIIYKQVKNLVPLDVSVYAVGNVNYTERYGSSPVEVLYRIKSPEWYDRRFNLEIVDEKRYILSYSEGGNEIKSEFLFGQTIDQPGFRLALNLKRIEPDIRSYFFIINSPEQIMASIDKGLKVDIVNYDANTIKISFQDHDPNKAHDIVAAIDSIYLIETLKEKLKAQEQTIDFLNEQLKQTEESLIRYELMLEGFARENKTTQIMSEFERLVKEQLDIEQHIAEVTYQIELLDTLKSAIFEDRDLKKAVPAVSTLESASILAALNQLNTLKQEKDKLLLNAKENSSVMKSKELELANVQARLFDMIAYEKKLFAEKREDLKAKKAEAGSKMTLLPSRETELNRMKRFYNLYDRIFLTLIEKKQEFEMAKAGIVPEFLVLAPASLSVTPISPKKMPIYLTALAVGVLLSLVWVVLQYFLHNTIDNMGDLERNINVPVLGYIPKYQRSKLLVSKVVVDENPKSAISEAMRTIRTNLDFIYDNRNGKKVICVSSTIGGEGKTFVAVNMAAVLAMTGSKVVIIDLDMRKPKVNMAFDQVNDKGMSTILIGKHTINECVHQSPTIETLKYITAGPIPPNPSELLLRPEFEEVLQKLKNEFDIVVIDSPPVALVTDGVILMKKADARLFVVRAEYSKRGFERNLNKLVRQHSLSNTGVVLNSFRNIKSYGYGYQYGYGYESDYYVEEKEKGPWWRKWL